MNESFINLKLFQIIGFTLTKDNLIQDQDSRDIINYRGEQLTYNNFKPLMNVHLMVCIFRYFLNKYEYYSDLYCSMYYEEHQNGLYSVVIHTNNGIIQSSFYKKRALAYIDCIFKIGGVNTNNLQLLD